MFSVLRPSETIKYIPQKAKELVGHFTRLLASRSNEVVAALEPYKGQLIEQMLGNIESLEVPEHVLLADNKDQDPKWFEGEHIPKDYFVASNLDFAFFRRETGHIQEKSNEREGQNKNQGIFL